MCGRGVRFDPQNNPRHQAIQRQAALMAEAFRRGPQAKLESVLGLVRLMLHGLGAAPPIFEPTKREVYTKLEQVAKQLEALPSPRERWLRFFSFLAGLEAAYRREIDWSLLRPRVQYGYDRSPEYMRWQVAWFVLKQVRQAREEEE